ncbi:MAG: MG2 domain-containing protein [bacterium]|nr:MG2 domain-containing protein [bacterium]
MNRTVNSLPTSPAARIAHVIRPRFAAAIAACVCVGAALAYAIVEQPPVGRVQGQVVNAKTYAPVAGAQVVLTSVNAEGEEKPKLYYALTDASGGFSLAHVRAGEYQVAAYLDTFSVEEEYVRVDEAHTSSIRLALSFARPQLQMVGPKRHFTTAESMTLPVRGYVDSTTGAAREIAVRVFRTRLSDLLSDERTARALSYGGEDWRPDRPLPEVLLHPPGVAPPLLVLERGYRVNEAGVEGFYTKTLDFGQQPLGLYLVEARYAGATVSTWLLVSDTALVLKRAPGEALAFVADARDGTPVADSAVRLYKDGKILAKGRTSKEGIARIALPATLDTFYLMTIAQRGADEAVIGRRDYRLEQGGPFALHAYTDRPIYRPGQRIYFKGIVRRKVVRGAPYAVPAGEAVRIEVQDPDGEPLLRQRHLTNAFGSFHGEFDLSPEAPTGFYSLVLTAGESTITHDIVVAAYRKPEFSVSVAAEKPRYLRGDQVRIGLSAQFYFGAPVAGAKASYTVYRTPNWYAQWQALYDDEPDEDVGTSEGYHGDGRPVAEGEVKLDEQGKAAIGFRAEFPDATDTPQDQIFSVQVSVSDPSGREVTVSRDIEVAAGDFRVMLRPERYFVEPGHPVSTTVLVRDLDRRPVPGVSVTLEMSYVRWDYGRREYVGLKAWTQTVTTGPDGSVPATVTLPRSGYVQILAIARDTAGREIRGDTWLWASGEAGGDFGVRYTDLSLQTDKRRYRAGETARVLLNADKTGQTALVTIEGDRIHRAFAVPVARRTTVISVPLLPEYGPNVILSALYVKDKKLARGEVALNVTVPERELKVTVTSDRPRYGPGDRATYTVQVTDAAGRPQQAELSLAVVDEAIYALQEDDPRALRNAFYPRRWNLVRTHFSFELWYLGDADKDASQIMIRRRFKDTAYWQPALVTDAQGRATMSFDLPDNLTTWRATVLAHTKKTRLGRGVYKAIVAREFFVRIETPRLFSQDDESRITALVHNETDTPMQATVRLKADGLQTAGSPQQTVTLAPRKVEKVIWPVSARRPGEARILVTAEAAGQPSRSDGVEITVPVRPYGRTQITGQTGDITAERPKTETVVLERSAIPEASRLTVRITPSVTQAAAGALEYLIGYPWGCVEQTMSRFLPTVMVQRVLRAGGLSEPDLERRIPDMVQDGLTRLYRFQNEEGGWGWWEFDEGSAWMTAYVLYGLATAKAEGYPVRESVLESGRRAALELAGRADPDTRMFLLYAVALAGDPEAARGLRAKTALSELKTEGVAYAVLLDRLLGRNVRPAFAELGRRAVAEDGTVSWRSDDAARWDWNERMATALALRAILAVDPRGSRIEGVVRWLMLNRTDYYWWSTRDTAWVLAALVDYLRVEGGAASATGEVRVALNGRMVQTYRLTPTVREARDLVLTLPGSALQPGENRITVERAGGTSRVFYTVTLRQTIAMDAIPALTPADIRIAREYLRLLPKRAGAGIWSLQTEPTRNVLRLGDRVLVRLTITTPRDLAYVVIEDPFPAGFEVTERGSAEVAIDDWRWWWDYTDVRDDRIAIFARRIPAGEHVIEYNMRAQTPGTYNAMPTLLEGMYTPRMRAESTGTRVIIR